MPIAPEIYVKEQFQVALAEQTVWNTPTTADASFWRLLNSEPVMPDWSGAKRNVIRRGDGARVAGYQDFWVTEEGAWPTFSVQGVVTSQTLHYLIYGVMQDFVGQGAAAAYQRTYEFDAATDGLNSGKPKKFFTFNFYDPASSIRQRLRNCVCTMLELSGDPGASGGLMLFKADFISLGAADRAATLVPGSWQPHGTTVFPWSQLFTRQLGGADLLLSRWKLTMKNGLIGLGQDADGDAEAVNFLGFEAKAEIVVKKDANTTGELANWLTNPMAGSAERQLLLRYGADADLQMFSFDMNAIFDGVPAHDFGNAGGVFMTLPLIGVDDGTNEAIEVKHANAVNMTW